MWYCWNRLLGNLAKVKKRLLSFGKVRTFSENLIEYKLERKIWISYPQKLWICLILVMNRVRDCFLSVRGTRIRQNMPSCDLLGSWKHAQTRVWRHFFWGPDPKIFFSGPSTSLVLTRPDSHSAWNLNTVELKSMFNTLILLFSTKRNFLIFEALIVRNGQQEMIVHRFFFSD